MFEKRTKVWPIKSLPALVDWDRKKIWKENLVQNVLVRFLEDHYLKKHITLGFAALFSSLFSRKFREQLGISL